MILASSPAVSVVIPTYKRPNLLVRSLHSVLGQSFNDLEVIVVVDGSKDGTPQMVAAIGEPRVRVIVHERNKGAPAARNTGIKAAKGAFVAFLDDDDIWLPGKLEKQMQAIADYDALLCGYRVVGRRAARAYRLREIRLRHLKKANRFGFSGLIVKAFIAKGLLFDETLPKAQDWDFLIRLALEWRIGYLPDVLCLVDGGDHRRITNSARFSSIEALKRRSVACYKHRATIGEYWLRYRLAADQMSYLRSQEKPLARFLEVGRHCGWLPSCHVLVDRAWTLLSEQ